MLLSRRIDVQVRSDWILDQPEPRVGFILQRTLVISRSVYLKNSLRLPKTHARVNYWVSSVSSKAYLDMIVESHINIFHIVCHFCGDVQRWVSQLREAWVIVEFTRLCYMLLPLDRSTLTKYSYIFKMSYGRSGNNFKNVIFKLILQIHIMSLRTHWWEVNIGLGNGPVPSDSKPLPELMLTQISVATLRR